MPTFNPVWKTPAGTLQAVTEAASASISLQAVRRAQFMGTLGQTTIQVGNSASQVTNVYVNTASVGFEAVGNSIVLANAVSANSIIELDTSEPINYSLLHDNLPPGLTLNGGSGVISGTVSQLPTDGPSLTYSFAVRITDGVVSRDRQFSIVANPVLVQATPPSWGSLPTQVTEQASPADFAYIPLGQTTRGSPFTYQLPLFLPGGAEPTLVVQDFLGATSVVSPYDTLPSGITVDPHSGLISGTIDATNDLGFYFFKIKMLDSRGNPITTGSGATPIVCGIEVSEPVQALSPLRVINWVTPAGLLASLYEGVVCPISVKATCTTGEAVSYALGATSVLPPGITLNTTTGDLQGVLNHVLQNETYSFTIRAGVGQNFADQTFSFQVLSRYDSATFVDMTFKLRVNDSVPMTTYYNSVIQADQYFRPLDPNFGTLNSLYSMNVFLAGGLNGDPNTMETIIRASNFDGPVKLLLGQHKIAYAKLNGSVAYEVLYRDVIDPLVDAGGFTFAANGAPVAANVLYPESSIAAPQYIYPSSLNNLRCDFVSRLGFPTVDPTLTYVMGIAGQENLPLWMTSPQTGNDTSTALGYIPAVVVAYLLPGQGQQVLNIINGRALPAEGPTAPTDPVRTGHVMLFDQYFVIFQTYGNPTTFDGAATTFDGATLDFDVFAYTGGKFFRINRSTT